jgi:hypothetical protein
LCTYYAALAFEPVHQIDEWISMESLKIRCVGPAKILLKPVIECLKSSAMQSPNKSTRLPPIASRITALVVALLLCSGCASTYRDKALNAPGAPTPAVVIQKFAMISDFIVFKIDDHNKPSGFARRFELVPGKHSVIVGLNEGLYRAEKMRIEFEAKAGETYEINAEMKSKIFSGTWHAWVTEVSTGNRFDGEIINRSKHDAS